MIIRNILFSKYFISLGGIVFISYYIWFRYLRNRMPRDIPFELTFIMFLVLILISLIYIYIIIKSIKTYKILWNRVPSQENKNHFNVLLVYISVIVKPLVYLDNFIKQHPIVQEYYKKLLIKITSYWNSYCIKVHKILLSEDTYSKYVISNILLYILWNTIPKICSLIILCIDIFYFHELHYIYVFIYISLIPLLGYYFIYSIRKALEDYLTFLETWYQVELIIPENDPEGDYILGWDLDDKPVLNIRKFLYYETEAIMSNKTYNYKCFITDNFYENLQKKGPQTNSSFLSENQLVVIETEFKDLIQLVIHLDILNKLNTDFFYNTKTKIIYIFQVIFNILYLFCWIYILVVSFYTLDLSQILNIIKTTWIIPEPFSDLILIEHEHNKYN